LDSSNIESLKKCLNFTHYIPTTTNRFELLSNLTKDADDYRPEKDTDKELYNYSGCLQRKFVHKETISMGNYKTNVILQEDSKAASSETATMEALTDDAAQDEPIRVGPRTSKRPKKPPTIKSDDFLW
jgi:hypothetical protein